MSKKISELTETIEPTPSDVLPIVNEGETKKSTLSSIINTIKIVLNNVYASVTHTHTKDEIEEADPTVPIHVKNITEENISDWNNKYELTKASSTTLGGIKVGANLTITEDGTLNATGGGASNILTFENVSVTTTSFVEDTTYEEFSYKAEIPFEAVTEEHFPEVTFNVDDAMSGNYAPVSLTGTGTVTIYAVEQPESTIVIPSIVCVRGA